MLFYLTGTNSLSCIGHGKYGSNTQTFDLPWFKVRFVRRRVSWETVRSPNDYKRVQLADSILENCLDSLKRIFF